MRSRSTVTTLALACLVGVALWALLWPGETISPSGRATARDTPHAEEPRLTGSPGTGTSVAHGTPLVEEDPGPPVFLLVLDGVVLDEESGMPVEDAVVFLATSTDTAVDLSQAAVTHEDGRFHLEAVDPVDELEVVANHYVPWRRALPELDRLKHITVELSEGEVISGIVLDDLDEPVPDARVWCFRSTNSTAWPHPSSLMLTGGESSGGSTHSSQDGSFVVRGLERGVDYEIGYEKPMWTSADWDRQPYPIRAGDRDVTLHLSPMGGLILRPIDHNTRLRVVPELTYCGHPKGIDMGMPPTPWLGSQGLPPASEATISWFARSGIVSDDDVLRIPVRIRALGYDEYAGTIEAKLGEVRKVDVEMKPVRGRPRVSVRFTAAFPDGTPYYGRLRVKVFGESTSGSCPVAFDEMGRSTEPVLLPPGAYRFLPQGAGCQMVGWRPAGEIVEREVGAGIGSVPVRLLLEGTPFMMRVRTPDGKDVHGFDLGVRAGRAGRDVERLLRWDLYAHAEGCSHDGHPVVWLPKGESLVFVNLWGIGAKHLLVQSDGSCAPCELELVLTEPAVDFRLGGRRQDKRPRAR